MESLLFLFTILLMVVYYLLTGPMRDNFKDAKAPTQKEQAFLLAGLGLLYVVKGSPVDLLAHLTFSAHMVQMALLYLVIPPLIIKGIPVWLWRSFLRIKLFHRIFKVMTFPLVAIILFNFVFSMYHLPIVFDTVKSHWLLHGSMTISIFTLSLFMWWNMLDRLKEWATLSALQKIGYIFLGSVLLTPACALLIFATNPLYSTYTDPQAWTQALALCVPVEILQNTNIGTPDMFQMLPITQDQQLGGVLMKIMQEIVYGIVLFRVFFSWFGKESEKIDPLPKDFSVSKEPQPSE
ncbi:cytochrome c oxidase assembly factor CtaG [Litoribacterium kuwaitense]|uniref:cytochrome c oxidase assembly factor CtaG n=1 Tax=Litoribacterium kuwaitense TaxID=1398745 RepID=UPI0028A78FA4|nr:cytochrome c oxidase assembly factor CtaG [Litoribacterium kuwaitense]